MIEEKIEKLEKLIRIMADEIDTLRETADRINNVREYNRESYKMRNEVNKLLNCKEED